jgi:hypothetical protein
MFNIMRVFRDRKNGHFGVNFIILCDFFLISSLWISENGQ